MGQPLWYGLFAVVLLVLTLKMGRALRTHRPAMERQRLYRLAGAERKLFQLRARVDRRVRRWGYDRRFDETILAFSERMAADARRQSDSSKQRLLNETAEWYRLYNGIRFRGPITDEAVEELRIIFSQLRGTAK